MAPLRRALSSSSSRSPSMRTAFCGPFRSYGKVPLARVSPPDGCATHSCKGACSDDLKIKREELERRVLDGLRERLLAPEMAESSPER